MGYLDSKIHKTDKGPSESTSSSLGLELVLREIRGKDLDHVLEIERASFASPWSRHFFLEELGATCARSVLSETRGVVVGYCLYWELPTDIDIHNIAVHPDYRRNGVGRSMLNHIIDQARRIGSQNITLEVRKSNEAAQALYRSLGFEICGVRRGYYSNDGEDAWIMILRMISSG